MACFTAKQSLVSMDLPETGMLQAKSLQPLQRDPRPTGDQRANGHGDLGFWSRWARCRVVH